MTRSHSVSGSTSEPTADRSVRPVPTSTDAVVVGAGLAGLLTALGLAARGREVVVLAAADAPQRGLGTSTALAQGGIAAAIGPDDDPALHCADTLAAGAGLTDPVVARHITAAAPAAVAELLRLGTDFDRDTGGRLRLGLEGAHRRHRIVHAHGDASGAEILRAVIAAALAEPRIRLVGGVRVRRVEVRDGRATGVFHDGPSGQGVSGGRIAAATVVLATGGCGALFAHTTNPVTSWGSGLALGVRAGASVRDMELVQFHPTALDVGGDPMPLVTEALRGAGVPLVLADGTALPDPLAARDVVARSVGRAHQRGQGVFLDVPGGPPEVRERFADLFPTVHAACVNAGLDPARDPLPVRPAAHYHMGGLAVDRRGRTGIPGLRAVGEVASTGLHGANRLASNSLLEAVVCAGDIAADPEPVGSSRLEPAERADQTASLTTSTPPTPEDRRLLEGAAGLLRDGSGLRRALATLRAGAEVDDARLVASLLLHAALLRTESRGAHQRSDHVDTGDPRHTLLDLSALNQPLEERSAS